MDDLAADLTVPTREFEVEVTLRARSGSPMAIVGPSGSGKTTTLRAIAGLASPRRGRIQLGDRVVFDELTRINLPPERRGIGVVFQEYALFPHLTVRQNVAFGRPRRDRDVAGILESLGVAHLANQRPSQLSGGERQRVAIARAIASNPRLLLLDEPTAALDVHTRDEIIGLLAVTLRQLNIPAITVSHSFEQAAVLADDILVIEQGQVVQSGTAAELLASPTSPFVARLTGMNVLGGMASRDPEHDLTVVTTDRDHLLRSSQLVNTTVPVSVLIPPADIALDTRRPSGSMLNVIEGQIRSIVPLGNLVRVQIEDLVVEVTASSSKRLDLRVGSTVFASFKATSTRLLLQPAGESHPGS